MSILNKQLKSIIESTEKFIINDELFEEQKQVLVSQIKQSILKAIMEEARKQYRCEFCNNTGKIWNDFVGNYVPCNTEHDCEEDKVVAIESVIKEILK